MPASLTYPGVYVEEIPSGVRTIAGVATSITAFIGRTRRGPVNHPVVINNFGDYEREFGRLWTESTMSFAVRDYFLNGGTKAIIVRLFSPIFADEAARAAAHATALAEATTGAQAVADAAAAAVGGATTGQDVVNAAQAAVSGTGPSPAALAAAQAVADAAAASLFHTPQDVADAANAGIPTVTNDAQAGADAVSAAAAGAVGGAAAPQDVADAAAAAVPGGTGVDNAAGQAVADAAGAVVAGAATPQDVADAAANAVTGVVNEATTAATAVAAAATAAVAGAADAAAVVAAANAAVPSASIPGPVAAAAATGLAALAAAGAATTPAEVNAAAAAAVAQAAADAADAAAPVTNAQISANGLDLVAASPGAWGNALRIHIDHDVGVAGTFNLSVLDEGTGNSETFRNLSIVAGDARRVDNVLANGSSLVRTSSLPVALPTAHTSPPPGGNIFDPSPGRSSGVTRPAADGNALAAADYQGSQTNKEGIYALEDADLFNLLCIPPYTPAFDVENAVWSTAAVYCEQRRAVLLVDAPSAWNTPAQAIAGIGTLPASTNAAIYFPRLQQPNPLRDNQLESFAPCGAVAGVIARTDTHRGLWKAPAGQEATVRGVPRFTVPLTDAENGQLNPLGINCLRNLPPAGRLVWGARTLRGNDQLASEWKYLPVRRTALFIEESLYRGLQWVVFEPNDAALHAQIRLNVGAFMHDLFRNGAFQGTSPDEAYLVKCDSETTTQSDINRGIVNILVGFAPLKPAEFVVLKLQQLAGQAQA